MCFAPGEFEQEAIQRLKEPGPFPAEAPTNMVIVRMRQTALVESHSP